MKTFQIDTRQHVELIEITDEVRTAIRSSGIDEGLAVVYTPHTTAAITINENADPDVTKDLVMALNKLATTTTDTPKATAPPT